MIDYSIKNPLVVNLFLLLIVIIGIISWQSMPEEMFPVVEKDAIKIITKYDGASPEEVEKQVTISIEDTLDNLQDVDFYYSKSSESVSAITLRLKPEADVDELLRTVRDLVDAIDGFPEEADDPEISRVKTRFPVISVSIFGETRQSLLFANAKKMKQKIMQLDGVAGVGIAGNRDDEIWVIINPSVISAKQVSTKEIISALKNNIRDLPGGSVKATEGDILLRGLGSSSIKAIENITLKNNSIGGQLLLKEIASVEQRLEEEDSVGRFNGKKAVNMSVTKTAEASVFDVSNNVRKIVKEYSLPQGLQVSVFSDFSKNVKTRLDTVKSSGLIGLFLLLLSLYLFLNSRVAFITAFGIPVSFLVAAFGMYAFGYTINMVSLFAFLVALGMVVDDAIIVTENTYRHIESGMDPVSASKIGAKEVFWPIVASTLTTIAAFLPMLSISGTLGKFIEVIPLVVTVALLGSLMEAFIVLPSHCASFLKKPEKNNPKKERWKNILLKYNKYLSVCIKNRYLVSSVTVGILCVIITFAVTRIPYYQFGKVDSGQFFINAEASITSSVRDTERLAMKLEKVVLSELNENELESLYTNVGVSFKDFSRFDLGSQYIQIVVSLKKSSPQGFVDYVVTPLFNLSFDSYGKRDRSEKEIINSLRQKISSVSGLQKVSIKKAEGGPGGSDIVIGVVGQNQKVLTKYAKEIEDFLSRIDGVKDVEQDQDPGKVEFKYKINNRGKELGLTQADIAESVRTGFLGLETAHFNLEGERVPVRLIYSEKYRYDSSKLYQLPIILKSGKTIYLAEVADIEVSRGMNTVRRRDGQRLAKISADVDPSIITPLEVTDIFDKKYKKVFKNDPSYDYMYLGSKKRSRENFADMKKTAFISLGIIFFILAVLFKTIIDPLVVLFSIPFAVVGVILGHILFGYNLQFLSVIGLLALIGIVVNDSLILIDFLKKLRKEGKNKIDATIQACTVRARPIILTSVTTFLGISPLIFFATGQTKFLSPMAVSLGFGLLFATILILIVLPCFYLIMDDLKELIAKKVKINF
ncbi:MAG: efflux RND transporter permease subunit [Gammaproteobacteria bacterium]